MKDEFRAIESSYTVYGIRDIPINNCYFCGHPVEVYNAGVIRDDNWAYHVGCSHCYAHGPIATSEVAAINDWNSAEVAR